VYLRPVPVRPYSARNRHKPDQVLLPRRLFTGRRGSDGERREFSLFAEQRLVILTPARKPPLLGGAEAAGEISRKSGFAHRPFKDVLIAREWLL
jgi:hypothetical protein